MMNKLEYKEIMWAEMSPDMYSGPNCDELKPRWHGFCEGDMDSEYYEEPLQLCATTFKPGTKVIVLEPCCPKCGQIASLCEDYEPCDFNWDEWVACEYS